MTPPDKRLLKVAPLPDPGTGVPSGETRIALRRMHELLLADKGAVAWSRIAAVEPDEPPLVRLAFMGPFIAINAAWCRYFHAQLHPRHGPAWLTRAAFYEPNAREVYLKPRHDPMDIEAAILWSLDADSNPLVQAKIGFNYVHPGRTLVFARDHLPFLN